MAGGQFYFDHFDTTFAGTLTLYSPPIPFNGLYRFYNALQGMTEAEVRALLKSGTLILKGVLAPHRFKTEGIKSGTGSGGSFAFCEFRRGSLLPWGRRRRLRLHFRYSLGLVEYEAAGVTLSHEDFMWSVLGRRGVTKYPGFSDDPLDGFRHLASDIANYAQAFLEGTDNDFIELAGRLATLRNAASRLPP